MNHVTRLVLVLAMMLVACSGGEREAGAATGTGAGTGAGTGTGTGAGAGTGTGTGTGTDQGPDCAALVRNAQAELAALSLSVGPCASDADCIVRQASDCCCLGPVVIPRANEYGWDRAADLSCDAYCDDRCLCAADFLPVRAVCVGGSCRGAPL
ncbi:MAG: hypothetical protein JRH11_17835 [Deltaproteobacteria bacterium]|nr:hypothetical protein [Deltaproteobacteria bacterium]